MDASDPAPAAPRLLAFRERLDARHADRLRALAYGRVERAEPFERQLEHLARHHPVVSVTQVLDTFEGGHPLPPGAVLLAFHDEQGFAELALPALRRHGFAAILFVAPARAEASGVDWAERIRAGVAPGVHAPARAESAGPKAVAESTAELRRALGALARHLPGLPRLLAHPAGRPGDAALAAARGAGVELGFTTLPGPNDLRQVDPLRLRSLAVDAGAPLDAFRTRLAAPAVALAPDERRAARMRRSERARLRFVLRPLDALLTSGLRPRPPLGTALRALVRRRSSHYERLRNLARLVTAPGLARALERALLDTRRLGLRATGVELAGYGSAATVFRLVERPETPAHVLKVYRWSADRPAATLALLARRHRARYELLRHWFGEHVLRTHFVVVHGPLCGLAVAACLQERIERATDLLALADDELVALLGERPERRAQFVAFARAALELREHGFYPDLLGRGNLLLVLHEGAERIRLIDYGLFDLFARSPAQPRAALDESARRLEALLGTLVPDSYWKRSASPSTR